MLTASRSRANRGEEKHWIVGVAAARDTRRALRRADETACVRLFGT